MSQAASPFETAGGYAPPNVTQFSVFLDNRVGKLHELIHAFEGAEPCRLCALNVHDAADHAVVRLVTENAKQAAWILRSAGFAFSETEVLLVELAPEQTVGKMCLALLAAELSIEFTYPAIAIEGRGPIFVLSVDDPVLAGQSLRKKRFQLLGEADLPGD